MFVGERGDSVNMRWLYSRHVKPVVADLHPTKSRRTFHDLRHTCAALLIDAGAHLKAFQVRLGHASIAITMDRYAHLMPNADAELADALDATYTATSWAS